MWFKRKRSKKPELKLSAFEHLLVVTCFIAAALTMEVVSIVHENAKALDPTWYNIYSIVVILGWAYLIVFLAREIERLYKK